MGLVEGSSVHLTMTSYFHRLVIVYKWGCHCVDARGVLLVCYKVLDYVVTNCFLAKPARGSLWRILNPLQDVVVLS